MADENMKNEEELVTPEVVESGDAENTGAETEPDTETEDAGYGGNETDENGEQTYEYGEWSGVINEPEKPVRHETPREIEPVQPVNVPTGTYYAAVANPAERSADDFSETEAETTVEIAPTEDDTEQVAYLLTTETANVVAERPAMDTKVLAHLVTALVVVATVGAMVVTNSFLKARKLKTAKANNMKLIGAKPTTRTITAKNSKQLASKSKRTSAKRNAGTK